MTNNHRISITNRRTTVWGYLCEGMQISQIATKLGVDKSTISKDIKFLVKDSQKYLDGMARQTLPFMYKQSIEGTQAILYECWSRFKEDHNPTWLILALDCQNSIFNQAANGVSVLAVKKITEKANALGLVGSNNNSEIIQSTQAVRTALHC